MRGFQPEFFYSIRRRFGGVDLPEDFDDAPEAERRACYAAALAAHRVSGAPPPEDLPEMTGEVFAEINDGVTEVLREHGVIP